MEPQSKREVISESKKTNYISELGIRYKTREIVTKIPIGKNRNGKQIFKSFTSYEPIYR